LLVRGRRTPTVWPIRDLSGEAISANSSSIEQIRCRACPAYCHYSAHPGSDRIGIDRVPPHSGVD
jgi:hypothetical protein